LEFLEHRLVELLLREDRGEAAAELVGRALEPGGQPLQPTLFAGCRRDRRSGLDFLDILHRGFRWARQGVVLVLVGLRFRRQGFGRQSLGRGGRFRRWLGRRRRFRRWRLRHRFRRWRRLGGRFRRRWRLAQPTAQQPIQPSALFFRHYAADLTASPRRPSCVTPVACTASNWPWATPGTALGTNCSARPMPARSTSPDPTCPPRLAQCRLTRPPP